MSIIFSSGLDPRWMYYSFAFDQLCRKAAMASHTSIIYRPPLRNVWKGKLLCFSCSIVLCGYFICGKTDSLCRPDPD